jgi:protein O-mannosyl-transferase
MNQPRQTRDNPATPQRMAFLLAVVTFALFASAIGYDFVNYDDDLYVSGNPHVLGGLNLSGLAYAFSTFDGGSWMPLTWISHLLDVSLFGVRSAGGHLINILLHAASAAGLFLAWHRMTRAFWRSAFVAAVFAFHPLRVESVVWIAERKDVLSIFFFTAGLLSYVRYVAKPDGKRYAAVFACLLLGLMSKPMLVTFPFVLLLLDHWPLERAGKNRMELRRNFWPLVREKIPLLLLCAFFAGLTFWTQKESGAVTSLQAAPPLKLLRVAENYTFYLGKFFWPARLSVVYETLPLALWHAVACLLVLVGVTWLALRWMFRRPWFLTGWFWYLGTLLPVVGLVRIGHITVADRYSYVPTVGLAVLLVWTAGELVQRRPAVRRLMAAVAVVLLAAGAAITSAHLPRWQNSITLFEDAVRKGNHEIAFHNLAVAYNTKGDFDRAIRVCTKAIGLYPDYEEAFYSRALAYNGKGDFDRAIQDWNRAIKLEPANAGAYDNRGSAYANKGEFDRAIQDFTTAINLDHRRVKAWNNRAAVWNRMGSFELAITDCTLALELDPASAAACNIRGNAYAGLGDWSRARADYDRAIGLDPSFSLAFNNRAAAYFAMKEFDRARADLRRCRQLGGQPNAALVRDLQNATGRPE